MLVHKETDDSCPCHRLRWPSVRSNACCTTPFSLRMYDRISRVAGAAGVQPRLSCCVLRAAAVSCTLSMLHDCIEHEDISSCAGCEAAGRTWEVEERRYAVVEARGLLGASSSASSMIPEPNFVPMIMGRRPKHIPPPHSSGIIRYKLIEKVTAVTVGQGAFPDFHTLIHIRHVCRARQRTSAAAYGDAIRPC